METRIQQRYKPSEEIELKRFSWMRWRTGFSLTEKPSPMLSGRDQFLVLVDGGPATACENYDPFAESELEIQFSELQTPDDVIRFANKFGLLGFHEVPWRQQHSQLVASLDESVSEWLMEAASVRRVLEVWDLVQAKDVYALRKMIRREVGKITIHFGSHDWNLVAAPGFNREWFRRFKHTKDPIGPANVYMATEVNRNLRKCASFGVALSSTYQFQPYLTPVNLLSAIWIRVSEILSGKRTIRTCEICHGFLDVTNNRSHKRVHAKCSLRVRVQEWRKKNEKTRSK